MEVQASQDEEVSATKKRKIGDVDESDVLIKTMNAKTPLILYCDISRVLSNTWFSQHSEELQKFMLSDEESFGIGLILLSHLSVPITVTIHSSRFGIKSNRYFEFPYDFPRVNDIISAISNKIKGLEIVSYPVVAYQKQAVSFFINKDLKSIEFSSESKQNSLPANDIEFLKKECTFNKVFLKHCCVRQPTLTDVLMMNSAQHKIEFHFYPFLDDLMDIEEVRIFPTVRKLELKEHCHVHGQWLEFVFDVDAISAFLFRLTVHLPNLTFLDIKFGDLSYGNTCSNWYWAYKALLEFNPHMFDYIPFQVKGCISISVDNDNIKFEDVMEQTHIDIEDEIVQKWNDDKNCMLVREFHIHAGLKFEFILRFLQEMDEVETDDEDEMDSDLSDTTDGEECNML